MIDALAQILKGIQQYQHLTYLWPDDVINNVMNTDSYHSCHNLMIPMHTKFNDDTFVRCLVIMKNAVISFIREYRGPILRPICDFIDDVIITKNTFCGIIWNDLFISEIKLKLCLIFQNFQNVRQFELATNFFLPEGIPEVEYAKRKPVAYPIFWAFDPCLSSNIDGDNINFKICPTLWHGDVIDDVMSTSNITCTTRHPKIFTCKILLVWHQSFIVKSPEQTSWQTELHTNKQTHRVKRLSPRYRGW